MNKSSLDPNTRNLTISKNAKKFNNWIYSEIKPHLKGNILEIGSGLGAFSEKIIRDFPHQKIILSDINKKYLNRLQTRYSGNKNLYFSKLDLANPQEAARINQKMDSLFALNVLEHIKNDVQALQNAYNLLNPGGTFTILVPCHKLLFNALDLVAQHQRRYTKTEMLKKIAQTKFKVREVFYFNFFSIFGWYLNGTLLKKKDLSKKAVQLFDLLVPSFSFMEEHILRKKLGISLIFVLEK